jgi:xanthine/uracil permease
MPPSEQPQSRDDRSIGELLSDLMRETTTLVRQEITLAKTEMTEKAAEAGRNVGALAVGGAVAYAGLLAIVAALVLILIKMGLSAWLSALIVGVVVAAIGGALVKKGLSSLKGQDMAPRKTIETFKEDAQWAKRQIQQ